MQIVKTVLWFLKKIYAPVTKNAEISEGKSLEYFTIIANKVLVNYITSPLGTWCLSFGDKISGENTLEWVPPPSANETNWQKQVKAEKNRSCLLAQNKTGEKKKKKEKGEKGVRKEPKRIEQNS